MAPGHLISAKLTWKGPRARSWSSISVRLSLSVRLELEKEKEVMTKEMKPKKLDKGRCSKAKTYSQWSQDYSKSRSAGRSGRLEKG